MQILVTGVLLSGVYALIALGYTMVYGVLQLINFAHGDVFMLGLFISLAWFTLLGVTGTLTGWQLVTILPLVFVLTMMTTAALNVTIDRVAYRPLRRSSRLAPLITAIGVSFMLENAALLWKGPAPFAYPDKPHVRIHGPRGYRRYKAYKPWLRDEFAFRYSHRYVSDGERAVRVFKGAEGKRLTYKQPAGIGTATA